MKIKYRSGYAEGGFLDDGATVDPMSGNEVPTGSLQEEVRDDIPAQLSEGEFVVPADVVRFIGLDKLMKMRDSAKKGLASMEEEGQIGGSPAPDMPMDRGMEMPLEDDDIAMDALIDGMDSEGFDEQAMNFAEGGMPTYEEYTGRKFGEVTKVENVTYVNDAGERINIRSIKGQPITEVPEGYYPVGKKPEDPENPITKDPDSTYTKSTVNDSTPNKDAFDRGDTRVKDAALVQSQIIRGARIQVLESMHFDNMTLSDMDKLYDSISPQARTKYEESYRNPNRLTGLMIGDINEAEKMLLAQRTVDSINAQEGNLEPKSVYTPNGEKINWKETLSVLAKMFSGGIGGVLSTSSVAKKIYQSIKNGKKKTVGNEGISPTKIVPMVYNQAYWANSLKEATAKYGTTKEGLLAAQREVSSQKLWASYTTGLDPYGRKLDDPVGALTIWDLLSNEQKANANTSDTLLDDPVEGTDGGGPSVRGATPATVKSKLFENSKNFKAVIQDNSGRFDEPEDNSGSSDNYGFGLTDKVAPVDTRSDKLLKEMAGTELPSYRPTIDGFDIDGGFGSNIQDQVTAPVVEEDTTVTPDPFGKKDNRDEALDVSNVGVTGEVTDLGNFDIDGGFGENIDEFNLGETIDGLVDSAGKAWDNFVNSFSDPETRADRRAERDAKQYRYVEQFNKDTGGGPKGRGNKNRSNVKETEVTQKQIDDANQKNSGRFDDKVTVTKPAVKPVKVEQDWHVGGVNQLAYGGLAAKKKPVVKKMRKDPTSGLAAKKKAKQKAQAKKGALAAKRT